MAQKSCLFKVDKATGLLDRARFCASPNHDDRPDTSDPTLVIIHGISLPPGQFGGSEVEDLFTNRLDWDAHPFFDEIRGLEVSAHLFIRRDGSMIQFVPFTKRAWHAGASCFRGRATCNDYSIGIELEGADETPYDDRQYPVLQGVIRALCAAFPRLTPRELAAHSDIAPGRKTDPGPAFDWFRLYDGLGNQEGAP